MKRISIFIVIVSILSAIVILGWIYSKYFRGDGTSVLTFPVIRGDITETVKVRGEAVSQKEFDLSFVTSGTVSSVFVKEGDVVSEGDTLIKLNTTSYDLEIKKLSAILAQRESNLKKLMAGYTTEDVAVTETKVINAKQDLASKNRELENYLNDAYTRANSAIGVYTDQFFDNPTSVSPRLNITFSDGDLKNYLESSRPKIGSDITTLKNSLLKLSMENLMEQAENAGKTLAKIRDYLEQIAIAINSLTTDATLTSTIISTYRSDVSAARTTVNTAIINLTTALEGVRSAQSTLKLAESELALKMAGQREEDIATAKAQISEIESDIAAARDKIQKATLTAPIAAKVIKIAVEKGETLSAGESAVILAASQKKIQADVSELDIVKIPETGGAETLVKFDAFPELEFTGKVFSIDPQEVIKDGDTYYRVNFYFDAGDTPIRSGMSADLEVKVASKTNVLLIPSFVIYKKDGKNFVKVQDGGKEKETAIITGLTDGESTEIVSGLSEEQTVIVSAN